MSDDFVSRRPSRAENSDQAQSISLHSRNARPSRRRVEEISSIASFVDFLDMLPAKIINSLTDEDEIIRAIVEGDRMPSFFINKGHSFVVHALCRPQLPKALTDRFPHKELQRDQIIVVKAPYIEPAGAPDTASKINASEITALREIAWECHVLSHPPIARSRHVVDILGIFWGPTLEGTEGQRYLPSLAVEFADQGCLEDLLQYSDFSLAFGVRKQLLMHVALGLRDLHASHIVHGDVKAGNILLFSDSTEGLVAKLSDFGFSIHAFDQPELVSMPGLSPPWDAPEIKSGSVRLDQPPLTDMYSYGLLVWRVLLQGRSPFDNASPDSASEDVFASLHSHTFRSSEWFDACHRLKADWDDGFLRGVKATLLASSIDHQYVQDVISATLRCDPDKRAQNMTSIILILENDGRILSSSKGPADLSSLQIRTGPVNEPETGSSEILPIARFIRSWSATTHRGYEEFGFYGGGTLRDLVALSRTNVVKQLPPALRHQIAADYRLQADDEDGTTSERTAAAFDYAMSILLSLHPGSQEEAMNRVNFAAENGHLQAQALTYRLHQSLSIEYSAKTPVMDLLSTAAASGSRIALEDLQIMDAEAYHTAKRKRDDAIRVLPFPTSYHGAVLEVRKEDILPYLRLDDPDLLHAAVRGTNMPMDSPWAYWEHTSLHFLASINDYSGIKTLAAYGVDLNARNMFGQTPLHSASQAGNADSIRMLLHLGADPSIGDVWSATPLHYAVYLPSGDVTPVVRELVQNGAEVNHKSIGGALPLLFPLEGRHDIGTPLHWAVNHNRLTMVSALLEFGANCLMPDGILELARTSQHPILAEELRSLASMDPEHHSVSSALSYAFRDCRTHMIEQMKQHLERHGTPIRFTQTMFDARETDRMHLMCLHGPDYQAALKGTLSLIDGPRLDPDLMGRAIAHGNDILVEFLLGEGFSVDTLIHGMSPLGMSLTKANGKISLELLRRGADPCSPSPAMPTSPMTMLALRPRGSCAPEIVEEMILRGATYQNCETAQETVYARAMRENWQDVLNVLVTHGLRTPDTEKMILRSLLSQNSDASLISLRGFLRHAADASRLPDPALDFTKCFTVFHVLMDVTEDIRDDRLNLLTLRLLLEFPPYSSPDVINLVSKANETALTAAVIQGNALGVQELLDYGASPDLGFVPPALIAVFRLFEPPPGAVGFRELQSSRRHARRHYANTVQMIITFASFPERWSAELRTRASRSIDNLVSKWQSHEFLRESMARGLVGSCEPGWKVAFPGVPLFLPPSPFLEHSETRARIELNSLRHAKLAMGAIWTDIRSELLKTMGLPERKASDAAAS